MATSGNERIRFRYGICLNDECPKCKSKEVQEIPARKELVCAECGKPLRECPPPKKSNNIKQIGIIAAIICLLGGVGIGSYTLLQSNSGDSVNEGEKAKVPETEIPGGNLITQLTITDAKDLTMKKGDSKRLEYQAVPQQNSETVVWESSNPEIATVDDGIVTAIKAGTCKITVKAKNVTSVPVIVIVEDSKKLPIQEPNLPKVSFGDYNGPANGLGGTIKVTKAYSLDLHDDGEPLQLSPGDEIQQTKFTNGELRAGVWVHNGSRRSFTR